MHVATNNNDDTVIEFLLQRLSDVNQVDGKGWTPLHYAAANNNVRLVLGLLKRHSKVDLKDELNMVIQKRKKVTGLFDFNFFFFLK